VAKGGKVKLVCERCGVRGRFAALPCCGWHACGACLGAAPTDSRGTPLCRWCVAHRERLVRDGLRAAVLA
jgi:hypothetical protein